MIVLLLNVVIAAASVDQMLHKMDAQQAHIRTMFERAVGNNQVWLPEAPSDCSMFLTFLREPSTPVGDSLLVSLLATYRPIHLLRLEDECKRSLKREQLDELRRSLANLKTSLGFFDSHPVCANQFRPRLTPLKKAWDVLLYDLNQSGLHHNRVPKLVFEQVKARMIITLMPLLDLQADTQTIDLVYSNLDKLIYTLKYKKTVHDRAIYSVLYQTYAEMLTLRDLGATSHSFQTERHFLELAPQITDMRKILKRIEDYNESLEAPTTVAM